MTRFLFWISVVSVLLACNSVPLDTSRYKLRDQRQAYVNSPENNHQQLKFPPDLRSAQISHDFDVKPVQQTQEVVSLVPPGSLSERWNRDEVGRKPHDPVTLPAKSIRMQEHAGHWVMFVKKPVDTVWVAMEDGIQIQNFRVNSSDQKTGRLVISEETGGVFQVLLKPESPQKTRITVSDTRGVSLSPRLEERVLNQLSDGLKGKSNEPLIARITKLNLW